MGRRGNIQVEGRDAKTTEKKTERTERKFMGRKRKEEEEKDDPKKAW